MTNTPSIYAGHEPRRHGEHGVREKAVSVTFVSPRFVKYLRQSRLRCFYLLEQQVLEPQLEVREIPPRIAPRGVLVPAAAELLRDRVHIDVALRTHADPPVVRAGFLEKRHRLDLLHRERQVDDAFSVLVGAAALSGELLINVDGRDAAAPIELHLAQDRAK